MRYTVVLLADPDGGYTAVVPAFPDCVSEGDSVKEALDMVTEAIILCSESAEEHGEEIPVEYQGTLVGEVDTESEGYWANDIESFSYFQESFGANGKARSREEIDAQVKVAVEA